MLDTPKIVGSSLFQSALVKGGLNSFELFITKFDFSLVFEFSSIDHILIMSLIEASRVLGEEAGDHKHFVGG